MTRLTRRSLTLAVALTLVVAGAAPPQSVAAMSNPSVYADDECATFPALGTAICGLFLTRWREDGGLAQQGYPLTNVFEELNPSDGTTRKVQYFERARFEDHPEYAAPHDVQLGLVGREQLLARYPAGPPAPGANPFTTADSPLECATFPETGKQLCGPFLAYWRANGGLARQGLPLTDIFLEVNATTGEQYPTQYFERARFEYHPASGDTPAMVLLGLLGTEQFQARYPLGLPDDAEAGRR